MEKSILITGAAKGIGRALSLQFASKGYNLALTDILTKELDELKKEIKKKYPDLKIETKKLDVTDYQAVQKVIKELDKALGGLDIVYANAGIFSDGKVGRGYFDRYKRTIEINLLGAIATIEAAVSIFKERKRGHIVAPSTIAAVRGLPRNASYGASKAGLSMFMESLRAELYRTKIKVTVLYLGYIDTDLNRALSTRPFLISAEKGAAIIYKLIKRQVKRSTVPVFPWNIVSRVVKILPTFIISKM